MFLYRKLFYMFIYKLTLLFCTPNKIRYGALFRGKGGGVENKEKLCYVINVCN